MAKTPSVTASALSTNKMLTASSMDEVNILSWMVTFISGLTQDEAVERLHRYGQNEITHEKPTPWYVMLLRNFTNPFVLVLIFLGIISYITADLKTVTVMVVMILLSV